jgi:large subunit ribosomal protein L16
MGSGKGRPGFWVALVLPGTILFEVRGLPEINARKAIRIAASKLPAKVQFLIKSLFENFYPTVYDPSTHICKSS